MPSEGSHAYGARAASDLARAHAHAYRFQPTADRISFSTDTLLRPFLTT